ncbi:MAG: hypothetical protein IJ359_09150 [Erysipelotrichaceae bacterium]|nr:hypothetical protein [Erysipelotrichaceae bacterium]
MKRKYPTKMFIFFVLMNFISRHFYLFIPGIILCIIGNWVKTCLWIGLGILVIDLVWSFIEQLQIRKVALAPSDNEDFNKIMDAFCGPEGLEGVRKVLESQEEPFRPFDSNGGNKE